MNCIHLSQFRIQRQDIVKAIMNSSFHKRVANSFQEGQCFDELFRMISVDEKAGDISFSRRD
jgi:hypothetical protein